MHRYTRPGHTIDGTPIARISASDRIMNIKDLLSRSSEERKQIIEQDPPSFCVPPRPKPSRHVEDMGKHIEGGARWVFVKNREDLSVLPYHQQEIEWLGAFLRSIEYLKAVDRPRDLLKERTIS
jgi:hypothetical protein